MSANLPGTYALFAKEVRRFLSVTVQTIFTPVVTTLLYLVVFGQALEAHVKVYPDVSYTAFLIPGLIMMSVIQNSFSNSSSSLIQSKMQGSLIFVLLAPLSSFEFFIAYILAAVLRGMMVGLVVYAVSFLFVELPLQHPLYIVLFAVLSSAILGALGIVAALWADKYDQLAGFQNFVILPLSFLSGVFYSIEALPDAWYVISQLNPFFYMIDGFRYGFFGRSDASPWISLGVCAVFLVAVMSACLILLQKGYKIRD